MDVPKAGKAIVTDILLSEAFRQINHTHESHFPDMPCMKRVYRDE